MMKALIFALTALMMFAATPAAAQVRFHGYVPPVDEAPANEPQSENRFGTEDDDMSASLLTLEHDQSLDTLMLPKSTLLLPGSGTIPNSEFLSQTLGLMGFETPTSPYVVLDTLTHTYAEVYSFEDLTGFLTAQPDGSVFIIGLDMQAGFIRKENGALTYLHSDTGQAGNLVAQPLSEAAGLKHSDVFIIGDLSERARILVGVDRI